MRSSNSLTAALAVWAVAIGAFAWQGWPGLVIAAVMLIVGGYGTIVNGRRRRGDDG